MGSSLPRLDFSVVGVAGILQQHRSGAGRHPGHGRRAGPRVSWSWRSWRRAVVARHGAYRRCLHSCVSVCLCVCVSVCLCVCVSAQLRVCTCKVFNVVLVVGTITTTHCTAV